MITTISIGENQKDITEVRFEKGDILMTRLQLGEVYMLALAQHEPHPIGETTNEFAGKTTDEVPFQIKVCLSFTNPKSLNALIHSLVELQKDLLNQEVYEKK